MPEPHHFYGFQSVVSVLGENFTRIVPGAARRHDHDKVREMNWRDKQGSRSSDPEELLKLLRRY